MLNGLDTVLIALLFKDTFLIAHSYLNLTYLQLAVMSIFLVIDLISSKGLMECRRKHSTLNKTVYSPRVFHSFISNNYKNIVNLTN